MTQYKLHFDDVTKGLEIAHQWYSATQRLYELWERDPMNLNNLLCVGTETWYCLLACDYDSLDPEQQRIIPSFEVDKLYEILTIIFHYGERNFSENAIFNAYFGYMIRVMPYFFLDCAGDYVGWQNKGKKMVRSAYMQEPNNPFVRAIYFEQESYQSEEFDAACKLLWSEVSPSVWGDSEVPQYFLRILNG